MEYNFGIKLQMSSKRLDGQTKCDYVAGSNYGKAEERRRESQVTSGPLFVFLRELSSCLVAPRKIGR